MKKGFSNNELLDMILMYGKVEQNGEAAVRLYAKKYPSRIHPRHAKLITNALLRLRETGRLERRYGSDGCNEGKHTRRAEKEILERIEENPCVSARMLAQYTNIAHGTVVKLLKENQLNHYYIRSGTMPKPDSISRLQFCRWLLHNYNLNENFPRKILVCSEVQFTLNGIRSFETTGSWSTKRKNAINLWAGIINGSVIGPFMLPNPMTVADYITFLQEELPELLEDVPLSVRQDMWFLHDEVSLHCIPTVQEYLRDTFNEHVIAPGAHMIWPERSHDLHPMDFFLWCYMKQLVYNSDIRDVDQLSDKIESAVDKICQENIDVVYQLWIRRANLCIQVNGGNLEHLL